MANTKKRQRVKEREKNELWNFSLSIYAAEEVEHTCLLMQDKLNVDVNMLFLCLWLGVSGRGAISKDELADVESQVAFWQQEIIAPLRKVRRRLKEITRFGGERFGDIRKSVLSSELDAEQVEQQMLEQAFRHCQVDDSRGQAQRLSDAINNLLGLLTTNGEIDPGWSRSISILLVACFPDVAQRDIKDIVDSLMQGEMKEIK